MEDNGTRETFGQEGAIRENAEDKTRPDLISPLAYLKLGEWARDGAKKYSEWNYLKGMPYSRYIQSMFRHLLKFIAGDKSENHLCGVAWNALALIHHEEMDEGKKLDDRQNFTKNS